MRRPLVIGNWKMNGDSESCQSLLSTVAKAWVGVHKAEVAVCPPFPYLSHTSQLLSDTNIMWGGQDLSQHESGAFTGEVSANMLADFGCKFVIVGHSERRQYHRESSEQVAKKFRAAVEHHLTPVLCVGETLSEREAGKSIDVVGQQLMAVIDECGLAMVSKGVVAYEPVWAIGTGETATPQVAQEVHAYIRDVLGPEGDQIRILYGGSVNTQTAESLFEQKDIDGALVGGASLKAQDFVQICKAAD